MSTLSPQMTKIKDLRDRRNTKLAPVIRDFKPAWIMDVNLQAQRDEMLFDVVFRPYAGRGWIKRRYRFEGEVDVLHYAGEVEFSEAEVLRLPDEFLVK